MSFSEKLISIIKMTKPGYKYNTTDYMIRCDSFGVYSIMYWNFTDVIQPTVAQINAVSNPSPSVDYSTGRKLRSSIVTLSDGLTPVKALRPVTCTKGGVSQICFITDEWVSTMDPSSITVTCTGDLDESIDKSAVIPHLVRAIQQLSDKIDTLGAIQIALNSQVISLNAQMASNNTTLGVVRALLHIA